MYDVAIPSLARQPFNQDKLNPYLSLGMYPVDVGIRTTASESLFVSMTPSIPGYVTMLDD
jgi:hypothetical protein